MYSDYFKIRAKNLMVILLYPMIIGFILEVLVQGLSFTTFPNLSENLLFSILIFFLINSIVCFRYGKKLVNLVIIVFYAILFIETGLYLLFQTRFNASYIYVILNTNFNEIQEFGSVYYQNNLIWLSLFFLPLFNFFPKTIFAKAKFNRKHIFSSSAIVLLILILLKFSSLIVWNLPYISIKSYFQYKAQVDSFEAFNSKEKNISTQLVLDNETIVIVVGESTTSTHMGLYGYNKETTPRLTNLSDSLYVYKDVISSHVYTTASIYDIFTLANYENNLPAFTLIDYIKDAGYKTYWLSNQRPVGFHDNIVSRLASSSDETLFLSYNDYRHNTLYDDVLLPKLEEKIAQNGKKVIFLHIIGTHYDYANRYPKEYEKFKLNKKDRNRDIINSYDNAVLYNDYVVSEVIKLVKNKTKKSAVLYFSDHGEEVFDTSDFFGHFQDKPTTGMYQIPFLMYLSPDYDKPEDFEVKTDRAYMLDDFPHSLTHLLGIESEFLDKRRSVFSSNFSKRPRIVQDSIDYDKTFKFRSNQ